MKLFVETSHCTSMVHCGTCRNKEDGRNWRSGIGRVFEIPDNNVDFECPHGKPWEYKPEKKPNNTVSGSRNKKPDSEGCSGCSRKKKQLAAEMEKRKKENGENVDNAVVTAKT